MYFLPHYDEASAVTSARALALAPAVSQPLPIRHADAREHQLRVDAQSASPLPTLPDPVLWGWTSPWNPSQWLGGPDHSAPYRAANIRRARNGRDLILLITSEGEAQINSGPTHSEGVYDADITVGSMRPGLVQAFFLYNKAREEVDFEVVGRTGIQLTIHMNGKYVEVRPKGYQGDQSGRRIGIRFEQKAGQWVRFFLDGRQVWQVEARDGPTGVVPSGPLQAHFDNWGYTHGAGWSGVFEPMKPGESSALIVHGYRYQPRVDGY